MKDKNDNYNQGKIINSASHVTMTFTDSRDGRIYKIIKIGGKTWMAENLAFKTNSGCWAYDDDESNVDTYGYLYDWETAKTISPTGWHIPSDDEWLELSNFCGDKDFAANKLKEAGLTHWLSPNEGVTNETGFTALPGGCRCMDGRFFGIGDAGSIWSSTEHSPTKAWYRVFHFDDSEFEKDYDRKECAFSVRCIQD